MQGGATPSRREFIAGIITTAVASHAIADELSVPRAHGESCTFGFGTYGMKSLSTEDAIRAIADVGFDSVMLDCSAGFDADPLHLSASRRGDIRKLLNDRGLRLPSVIDDLHPDASDEKNTKQEDHLKAVAGLCRDLSPDRPVAIETMLGGSAEWAKARPPYIRRVEGWVKIAAAHDLTLAIKPHSGTSMYLPQQAIEIIKALGAPPRLRLCYDYSHFVLTDLSLDESIRISLPWTAVVVMKDALLENGKRIFKLSGETKLIDYPALLKQLYSGGYRGDFSCEISSMIWKKTGYDPVQTARQCYANLAPAFAAAGVPRPNRK